MSPVGAARSMTIMEIPDITSVRQGQRPADERQAAERAPGGQPTAAVVSDETLPLGESTAGMPKE